MTDTQGVLGKIGSFIKEVTSEFRSLDRSDLSHDASQPSKLAPGACLHFANEADLETRADFSGARDLPSRLRESARRNMDRQDDLRVSARSVRRSLIARNATDSSQVAGMVRFLIAAAWIAIGIYFYQAHTNAQINDAASLASGMPIADARTLSSVFLTLGGTAGFASIALLLFIFVRSQSLKNEVRSRSENFGMRIAHLLKDYDARLKQHRDALADKARSDDSVVTEVSEAHMTAQEAMLLFEDVGFLADARSAENSDQMRSAIRSYRGYLGSLGGGGGGGAGGAWFEGLIMGTMFGLLLGGGIGFSLLTEITGLSAEDMFDKLDMDMMQGFQQYPSLLLSVLGGGTLFLLAGTISGPISTAVFGVDRDDRLRESLNEIRGVVTGEEAPRAADIARRVDDLSEIFRVRLMNRPNSASISATAPGGRKLADQELDDVPQWRRPKEGPRFVESNFSAMPDRWRTDAFAQYSAKKNRGEPGSKRGFLSFKKSLND